MSPALLILATLGAPWGVAVPHDPEAAAKRGWTSPEPFEPVRQLGASAVLLPVTLRQRDVAASVLTWRDPASVTRDRMRRARATGLDAFVMPLIELTEAGPGEWRGVLAPEQPAAWWSRYTDRVRELARWADDERAAGLVIGSELTSLQSDHHRARWTRVARAARERFSGVLIYAANHDALDAEAPFSVVDWIGVSAYFPLADYLDPTFDELTASWKRAHRELEAIAKRWGKPLVVVEVGAPSVDGAAMSPWDYTTGAPIDLEEQADIHRAFARVARTSTVIHGAFFWAWSGPGGEFDRSHCPRGKPAERTLRELFEAKNARGP